MLVGLVVVGVGAAGAQVGAPVGGACGCEGWAGGCGFRVGADD